MKKLFFIAVSTAFLVACNSDKPATTSGDSGPSTTNVQNVNGNIPDSTSGIKLDTKGDSTNGKKDSATH